ncbi:MAG TPA: hypothetical protein VEX42_02160 [Microbacterium sp.]|nr:hypothetical protein [Microbacterium sp.]
MPHPIATAPFHVRESPVELFRVRDSHVTRQRFRAPEFVRVRPGVHAIRHAWTALRPWERYLARVHAFAVLHPDAIFSHESAAALYDLPIFGEPRDIHVFDPGRSRSRRFGDVLVHTSEDVPTVHAGPGIRVVSAVHAALDLMRVLPPAFALAVGDAVTSPARGLGGTIPALRSLAADQVNRRGRVQLAWLWPRIDGRAESAGESVSRVVIEWCGFELPRIQRKFHFEGFTDRVDFFWEGPRIAGESDGYGKYLAETPQQTVERVVGEKKREDRLRRNLSGFTRWDWSDTMQVAPLRRALVRVGVPVVRPPAMAYLPTLRVNVRSR